MDLIAIHTSRCDNAPLPDHALPIMSSVLLGHQAVPELVPVVKMSMVPLRIRPKCRFCAMAKLPSDEKPPTAPARIANVDVDHPPALVGRLAVAADPARE